MLLEKTGYWIRTWVTYSALSLKYFYWLGVNPVWALLAVYSKLFVPASIKRLDCRNKLVSPCKRLSECHSFRFVASKSRGENPQQWPRWASFNILNLGFSFQLEEARSLERLVIYLSVSLRCKWYILMLNLVICDPWDWRKKGGFVIVWWASQVSLVVKNCLPMKVDVRDVGLIPGLGRSPWRRTWQPISVCLPGESYSQRSLVGYSPRGHKESDRTEATWHTSTHIEAVYEGSWFWAESLYLIVGS